MSKTEDQPGTEIAPVISPELMRVFAEMAAGIPDADDSQAYESILTTILTASSVDQLNEAWESEQAERLANHNLRVETMHKRPSDFAEGLGVYIVIKGTDQGTGERFTWMTGSVANVAQLVRCYFLGGLPFTVRPVIGEPNSKGYRPQHLQVVALNTGSSQAPAPDEAPF